jgi:hypothetical protein
MLCLEEQYAKISILWNIPLPVRIAAKRFRWCWTYPCTSKLMWKIAKCAATPLRSVTPCRTKSWRNFRPGLWDDRRLKCQRIATIGVGGWHRWGLHSSTVVETCPGRCRVMRHVHRASSASAATRGRFSALHRTYPPTEAECLRSGTLISAMSTISWHQFGLTSDPNRPWLLRVWVYFQRPRPDGLSSSEEFNKLVSLEDTLRAALDKKCSAVLSGCITTDGRIEFA